MTEPLRIVTTYMTNPFEPGQGGGVRYVRNLLQELSPKCEEILFLGMGPEKKVVDSATLIPITPSMCGYPYFLFRLCLKLLFLDLSRYSIVHVHRGYFAIPFLILKPHLKVVCSLHGRTFAVFEENFGKGLLRFVRPIFTAIERFALKRASYLAPVSRDVVRSFSAKYPELMEELKERTEIIGSMLELSAFKPVESDYLKEKYGAGNTYLVFLGRLAEVKDVAFLIKLFAQKYQSRPNVKLVLVGKGEKEAEYREMAARLCPDNTPIFHGVVTADEVPVLLQSADLMLLCSQHEASPTVVKESFASGVPLVTNMIGDVDEFVIEGKNGFIVEKNVEDYFIAIEKLLENPLSRQEVYQASAENLKRCTREYVGEQYLKIYRKIL